MAGLSADESRALAALDGRGRAMLAQVEAWAAINSGSRNLDGLARMAGELQAAFAPLGGDAALHDPEPASAIDAQGQETPLAHGRNLLITQRPHAPVQVILTGHMDTVFPSDHPFQQVSPLSAGVVGGPGVADMKGGLSVMLAALQALEASPFAEGLGWRVVVNSDEEVSSLGSAPLLWRAAQGAHAGLTYEPSMPDGALAGGRKGSGNFSAVVRGRAAHAGREPEAGRNAVVAAADLALRLAGLPARRPGLSVNPAKLDGGGPNNVVPDRAVLRFNVRPTTPADQAWAQAEIEALAAQVSAAHEVEVALHGGFARPPKPLDDNQLRLFRLVRASGAALGLPIGWRDTGGVCDGNNIAACGVPVVDTLGVRGGAIHSADEYLLTDSLEERARLSALVLMRLAQGALPA